MQVFIWWIVYGQDRGGRQAERGRFPFKDESSARELAATFPGGYVQREKRRRDGTPV